MTMISSPYVLFKPMEQILNSKRNATLKRALITLLTTRQ